MFMAKNEKLEYIPTLGPPPKRSTIRKVRKLKKKGKPLPTYEEYLKYFLKIDTKEPVSREHWDKITEHRRYERFKEARANRNLLVSIYVVFGLLIVGVMTGCIIYHIGIDDILQGILLALGFPIFIIAGFFGAGKGL